MNFLLYICNKYIVFTVTNVCMRGNEKLPVPKFKKGLGTSVHIVKITSFKKKITQPPEIYLKN